MQTSDSKIKPSHHPTDPLAKNRGIMESTSVVGTRVGLTTSLACPSCIGHYTTGALFRQLKMNNIIHQSSVRAGGF